MILQHSDIQTLRKLARAKRRSLSSLQQRLASQRLFQKLKKNPNFLSAKHIAVYSAIDGELSLEPIIQASWRLGKHCYLPSVNNNSKLLSFYAFKKISVLRKKSFEILESKNVKAFKIKRFDLVLMPLVAFDKKGNRLGMGGGYYDYSFQHLAFNNPENTNNKIRRTRLIGVAHRCQEIESIKGNAWDIKPDTIFSV